MRTGNKTRTGGLNQAEVDARVAALNQAEVDARVAALVQAAMLEANKGKAIRVDTGAAEVPQTGVVYYAPAPYNLYPGARMQRFAGTGAGATIALTAEGVAALPLASFGGHRNGATGNYQTHGQHLDTTFNSAITVVAGAITLERGSALDDASDGYDIIVIYIPA